MESYISDLGTQGRTHDDTEAFDDYDLVNESEYVRLAKLRIWYDEFVHGVKAIYETSDNGIVKTPKRMAEGTDFKHLQYKEIQFDRNEYITKITGHNGAVIDHVVFHTNTGKELRFGESDGGEEFELDIPSGFHVVTLQGGYGEHLHNIGCKVGPIKAKLEYVYAYDNEQRIASSISEGPTHDDTEMHSVIEELQNSSGQHRIDTVTVFHRDDCVLGLKVDYEELGKTISCRGVSGWVKGEDKKAKFTLENNEYITNIRGYIGAYCDKLVFETSTGCLYEYGDDRDDNFNFEIPEGQIVSGLEWGNGDHLHNITAHYGPCPRIFVPSDVPSEDNTFCLWSQTTDSFGDSHDDTEAFDDRDALDSAQSKTRIKSLSVYYDDGHVFGISTKWDVKGKGTKSKHVGHSFVKGECQKKTIKLAVGEYITRVWGRSGSRIDQLNFETSDGDTYEFGGDGGNEFDFEIPAGCALGAFSGGHNGHLHNLTAHFGRIDSGVQGPSQMYYYTMENRFPHESFVGGTHDDTEPFGDYESTLNSGEVSYLNDYHLGHGQLQT